VAVAIEMFRNLKELSLEDLVGCLRAAEDRFESSEKVTDKAGRLLLTEEEWAS